MSLPYNIIPCPLSQAARDHASCPAVIWGSRRITYKQLSQFVNTTVKALKERNFKSGSRVAVICDNSVEEIIILLSLWRLGAVACPVNPRFLDEKIALILRNIQADGLIIGQPKAAAGLKLSIPKIFITDLIVFDVKDSLYKQETALALTVDLNQEAAVILTSGTSSEPKAALLTYGNLYFNALGSSELIPLESSDRWLLALPLFHVSGLGILFRCLLSGAAVVIAKQEDVGQIVRDGKVTHVSMVPTQLYRLLNDNVVTGHAMSLRCVLLGGSAIAPNLIEQALRFKLPVYVSYGLTEMASQVATGRVEKSSESRAKVLAYRELKVAADGEICVRGQTLFKGYLESNQIRLPLDPEGWFHTGDLGSLNSEGVLNVLGRSDNMFISCGENIHPEEIERELLKIDGIIQAVVLGRPDQEFGQRPVVFIQWSIDAKPLDVLRETLAQRLPKFKIPVEIYPWPDVKQDGVKLDRKALALLVKLKEI